MHFLKSLFLVAATLILVVFAHANRQFVTVNLWGGLQADARLYVLILIAVLIGFLPTFIVLRARIWSLKRRLESAERQQLAAGMGGAEPKDREDRVMTENKLWPAP
ncbi:MAG: lipopolysaccharide assembly protein LapA domain-containing protein [Sphingomonadaceae bacterium]